MPSSERQPILIFWPCASHLIIPAWHRLLRDYADPQLLDCLEFGFPTNYCAPAPAKPTHTYHRGDPAHTHFISDYVELELVNKALLDPFLVSPILP